jgi:hypothetical protein
LSIHYITPTTNNVKFYDLIEAVWSSKNGHMLSSFLKVLAPALEKAVSAILKLV